MISTEHAKWISVQEKADEKDEIPIIGSKDNTMKTIECNWANRHLGNRDFSEGYENG